MKPECKGFCSLGERGKRGGVLGPGREAKAKGFCSLRGMCSLVGRGKGEGVVWSESQVGSNMKEGREGEWGGEGRRMD